MKAIKLIGFCTVILLLASCSESPEKGSVEELQAIFPKGELGPAENFTGKA